MVPLSTQESILKVEFSNVKYCDIRVKRRKTNLGTSALSLWDRLSPYYTAQLSLPLRREYFALSLFDTRRERV
jgi:hypothetical protein